MADSTQTSSPKRCRKVRNCILIAVVLLLLLGTFSLKWILTPPLKVALATLGKDATGCEISVGSVDLSLLRGKFSVENFVVGNPEGYKTDSVLDIGTLTVEIKLSSLFSDTIQIEKIHIQDPKITYEVGLGNSNVGTLLDNMSKGSEPEKDKKDEPEPEPKPEDGAEKASSKKVTIDQVLITGGQINLSAKILSGTAAPIPLPEIKLNDIGKGSNTTTIAGAVKHIFVSMFTSVADLATDAFKALGGAIGGAGKAIGDAAVSTGKAIGDAAKGAYEGLKGIFTDKDKDKK